ncbi:MAG: hypothetical protein JOZ42_01600 [Acetobacteraceae bacterium]|nr:hypothetical protein [Acetobacteraceae bacterium]
MTFAQRVEKLNAWYEGLPEDWRFQAIVWFLVVISAINMTLTIAIRFPFGLLTLIAIIAVAIVRAPQVMGWVKSGSARAASGVSAARMEIQPYGWVTNVNRWYDGLPETRSAWVPVGVLLIAGALNMIFTVKYGFPFGLLFLLALLALIAIRAPYSAGWLATSGSRGEGMIAAQPREQISHDVHVEPVRPAPAPLHATAAPIARDEGAATQDQSI